MSTPPLNLAVIIGSTRVGRFGPTIAHWFATQCERRTDLAIDVIDLAEFPIPAVFPEGRDVGLAAYTERIERADAIVVVTPEYNHGYPASLKQAIDVANAEWQAKPVAFVSYGGASGGIRAVEQLRQVFAELHMVTIRSAVSFHGAWLLFDASGQLVEPERHNASAKVMLDELTWWASALRTARASSPYAA